MSQSSADAGRGGQELTDTGLESFITIFRDSHAANAKTFRYAKIAFEAGYAAIGKLMSARSRAPIVVRAR